MTLIFDDDNADQLLLEVQNQGYSFGCLPRVKPIGSVEFSAVYAEHVPLIPESQWKDRIRDMSDNGDWIGDQWKSDPKADYQNGLGYCWTFSMCQSVMAVRAVQGLPFVQLSATSLAEDVGYRNRGNSLDSALEYATRNGIATRETVPQFSINPSEWKPEYKTERQRFMPVEWFDLDGADVWPQTVTALLSGFGCWVGLAWAAHAVFYDRLVLDDKGRIGVHSPNSHGPGQDWTLFGSKAVPSMGSFVLRSVTQA